MRTDGLIIVDNAIDKAAELDHFRRVVADNPDYGQVLVPIGNGELFIQRQRGLNGPEGGLPDKGASERKTGKYGSIHQLSRRRMVWHTRRTRTMPPMIYHPPEVATTPSDFV